MPNYSSESYDSAETAMTSLSVSECGWQHSGGGFSYGPVIRRHFVIHYIVSGKGVYEVNGKQYLLEAGDGFVIRPGEPTFYRADIEEPWHYYWVGFFGSEAARLLSLAGLEGPVFSYRKDDRLKQHLADIYFASRGYSSRSFAMIGHLYLFFSCMITAYVRQESPAEETVGQAVRYLEDHLSEHVTVEALARVVGVERSTLYRLFQQVLGTSPLAYIRRLKLSRACCLLEDGLGVERVGESVGYGNPAHFAKVFRQEFGCAPTIWRKQREK